MTASKGGPVADARSKTRLRAAWSVMSSVMECKAGPLSQTAQAPILEADVVSVVQVVDTDDGMAGVEEQFTDPPADEAGGTGHEDFHLRQ
jgi:hypothetical protein